MDGGEAQSCAQAKSSGEFFDVLGVKPVIGRDFVRADEERAAVPDGFKVILSHKFWQQHFKARPKSSARPDARTAEPTPSSV